MLTAKCMDAYRKQYPNDECFFAEETGNVMIERTSDGQTFTPPKSENEKIFLERLECSKVARQNLFYNEWELFECDDDCDY